MAELPLGHVGGADPRRDRSGTEKAAAALTLAARHQGAVARTLVALEAPAFALELMSAAHRVRGVVQVQVLFDGVAVRRQRVGIRADRRWRA